MENKGDWCGLFFGIGLGEHAKQRGLEYIIFWDRVRGTWKTKGISVGYFLG